MDKILSKAQAEAVYSAMVALNNVGGRIAVTLPWQESRALDDGDGFSRVRVVEAPDGGIEVFQVRNAIAQDGEQYASQAEFAQAYGL